MKKITGEDLIRGDHIYVRRGGLTYSHHGIYGGEKNVIHFKGAEMSSILKGQRRRNGTQRS